MNKVVVQDERNGFLVNDDDQWIQKLCELIINKELRSIQGNIGRLIVTEKFSLQNNISVLISLLKGNQEVVKESFDTIKTPVILEELNVIN
jgi:glycosyltransferase involved in cell wall biosynthesis